MKRRFAPPWPRREIDPNNRHTLLRNRHMRVLGLIKGKIAKTAEIKEKGFWSLPPALRNGAWRLSRSNRTL
jgi:hypothetical protein